MFTSLLAALKAIPRIVDALERLADIGTAIAAQNRKGKKDEMVDDLIARALANRMSKSKNGRLENPDNGKP
jgi:hypothetical protein